MKTLVHFTIISIISLTIVMCNKHDHMSNMNTDKTKIVMVQPLQFSVELLTHAEHDKMMNDMNMKLDKTIQGDHLIMVTVANKEKKQLIKNAKLTIGVMGPNNKMQQGNVHAMSGDGMHHYSAGFKMKDAGKYTVQVKAMIDGKEFKANTDFTK